MIDRTLGELARSAVSSQPISAARAVFSSSRLFRAEQCSVLGMNGVLFCMEAACHRSWGPDTRR